MKLREVLEIAIQVATALAAAPETGIAHRDIKPDNVSGRPDDMVKVSGHLIKNTEISVVFFRNDACRW